MNRSTIEPTRSASPMPATVRPGRRISGYPARDGLANAARRLGYKNREVLQQKLYGYRNAVELLAVTCEELVLAGQTAVAEGIRARINAGCDVLRVPRPLHDLLQEEQALDGAEDEAQVALLVEDTTGARDTYRRRALRYRAIADEILRALEAE